jgi:hypothetical protein
MGEPVVIDFVSQQEAVLVLIELRCLQEEYLINMEDSVVPIRQPDGSVQTKQGTNLTRTRAASGALSERSGHASANGVYQLSSQLRGRHFCGNRSRSAHKLRH